jgi:hypothetical protein
MVIVDLIEQFLDDGFPGKIRSPEGTVNHKDQSSESISTTGGR